jgi:hypothetical protein
MEEANGAAETQEEPGEAKRHNLEKGQVRPIAGVE